jgi:hypothetical protein
MQPKTIIKPKTVNKQIKDELQSIIHTQTFTMKSLLKAIDRIERLEKKLLNAEKARIDKLLNE